MVELTSLQFLVLVNVVEYVLYHTTEIYLIRHVLKKRREELGEEVKLIDIERRIAKFLEGVTREIREKYGRIYLVTL